VADYLKVISVQRLSREALAALAPAIATLARAEGLEAHARSVEVRIQTDSPELPAEAGSSTLKRAPRHD
jgi:histidinol dehydrogenase